MPNPYDIVAPNFPPTVQAVIANGQSLTDAIDLGSAYITEIMIPASWTTANLTFQVSHDGITYGNLYADDGNEVVVQAAAGRVIRVQPADWYGVRYLKIRSGTNAAAVNQGAARTLSLALASRRDG